jgi:hypothetical protein
MRKNIAVNTSTKKTAALSTTKSSAAPRKSGGSTQPLELVAARLEIQSDSESSLNAVKTIAAVCLGLMDQTMSGDCLYFALSSAHQMAVEAGVPPEEAERAIKAIGEAWKARRHRNPISGMF